MEDCNEDFYEADFDYYYELGTYELEDDLYQMNQREADDYTHEDSDVSGCILGGEGLEEPEFDDDGSSDAEFGAEFGAE